MTEWRECQLGDIGTVVGGGTPPRERADYWDGPIPWLTPGEITGNRKKYVSETKDGISTLGLATSGARLLSAGSLLMTSRASIGSCALASKPMATNQGFTNLTPGTDVDPSFLFHLGLTLGREMTRRASGTTFLEISAREFGRIAVRLPPLEEQRRIAEILDTIDETIQATERVITKLWAEWAGAMEDQLAMIDEQCRHCSLLDVVSLPSGQVDPRVNPYSSMILVAPDHILGDGRGRLVARVSAEVQGAISGKYRFVAGDVVYSKIRPELRKAWLATFDGLCSADMYPLSPGPRLHGGYLSSVILGQRFSRFAASVSGRSSGMPKVNRRELAAFQIALPRLEVQKTVADLAESYERRIDVETAILHKTIGTRVGLAADLLSGRVGTVAA